MTLDFLVELRDTADDLQRRWLDGVIAQRPPGDQAPDGAAVTFAASPPLGCPLPACQGPFALHGDDSSLGGALDLRVLASNPCVLAVGLAQGCVALCFCVTVVRPAWEGWSEGHQALSELFVYEKHGLQLRRAPAWMRLHRDPLRAERLFVQHACGVDVVTAPWLLIAQEFFSATDAAAGDTPDLDAAPGEVSKLLCTVALDTPSQISAPVIGTAVVYDQVLGYALVCQTSDPNSVRCRHATTPPPPPFIPFRDAAATKRTAVLLQALRSSPANSPLPWLVILNCRNCRAVP